ncbi:MAG: AraC family transcriptional regulator [Pseudomonadota bacterium]
MPTEPTIQATLARSTFNHLMRMGVPIDRVSKEVGLLPDQTEGRNARIVFHKHALLLEVAARELRDPGFGMHLGLSLELKDLDLLGYICLNSATLGDCLDNLVRYCRVFSDGFDLSITRDGDFVTIVTSVLDEKAVGLPQSTELRLSLFKPMLSTLIGEDVELHSVEMPHARIGPASEYERVFGVPVRFHAAQPAVIINRHLLDAPIQNADHGLLEILTHHAEDVLERLPGIGSLRHDVQNSIASRLQSGQTSIDDVARELGMSSRTLARRLKENGISYRELLNQLRRQLALRYLNDGRHTQAQIAYLLGFTDVSAFSHAFKRWTGSSPSRYVPA